MLLLLQIGNACDNTYVKVQSTGTDIKILVQLVCGHPRLGRYPLPMLYKLHLHTALLFNWRSHRITSSELYQLAVFLVVVELIIPSPEDIGSIYLFLVNPGVFANIDLWPGGDKPIMQGMPRSQLGARHQLDIGEGLETESYFV